MTAYAAAIAVVVLAVIVIAVLVGAVRLAIRSPELARDSLTAERLENLEQFVR